jgi:prepilin-type processing-associated H-X9-DG protein
MLVALLLPALNKAREAARRVQCSSNLHQMSTATLMYAQDNKQLYPVAFSWPYPWASSWFYGPGAAGPYPARPIGCGHVLLAKYMGGKTLGSPQGQHFDQARTINPLINQSPSANANNYDPSNWTNGFNAADPDKAPQSGYGMYMGMYGGLEWTTDAALIPQLYVKSQMKPKGKPQPAFFDMLAIDATGQHIPWPQNHNLKGGNVGWTDGHVVWVPYPGSGWRSWGSANATAFGFFNNLPTPDLP